MSPEQVRSSKNVDPSSDVWSMGVILHELLCGRMLFEGESVGDVFAKIIHDEIPRVSACRPDVPAELDAVIAACLSRDRSLRPANAAALLTLLAPYANPGRASPRTGTALLTDAPPASALRLHAIETTHRAAPALSNDRPANVGALDEQRTAPKTVAPWSGATVPGARRTPVAIGLTAMLLLASGTLWSMRRTPAAAPTMPDVHPFQAAVASAGAPGDSSGEGRATISPATPVNQPGASDASDGSPVVVPGNPSAMVASAGASATRERRAPNVAGSARIRAEPAYPRQRSPPQKHENAINLDDRN